MASTSNMRSFDVVIVGAGQAGGWVAKTLLDKGFRGNIALIGDEQHLPYERPELSKSVLAGLEKSPPYVLDQTHISAPNLLFMAGTTVSEVDRTKKAVRCSDGSVVSYGRLVLAQGGRPRMLPVPGTDLPGVLFLRTFDQCLQMSHRLESARHVVVVGGGWIGLEVASTARKKGVEVTLIEAADRLCGRSVPHEISNFLANAHAAAGVHLHLARGVKEIVLDRSGGLVVHAGDLRIPADLVVVGVGQVPNVELAVATGLAVDNGVTVDELGRTSDPFIFAAGDISNHPNAWGGRRLRLESWANAQNQGIAVGSVLAGGLEPYDDIPWFWSDQYDFNLQVVGIPESDATSVVRGELTKTAFSIFQFKENQMVAAIGVNKAREVKLAKRWMRSGKVPTMEQLKDLSVALEKL